MSVTIQPSEPALTGLSKAFENEIEKAVRNVLRRLTVRIVKSESCFDDTVIKIDLMDEEA